LHNYTKQALLVARTTHWTRQR